MSRVMKRRRLRLPAASLLELAKTKKLPLDAVEKLRGEWVYTPARASSLLLPPPRMAW